MQEALGTGRPVPDGNDRELAMSACLRLPLRLAPILVAAPLFFAATLEAAATEVDELAALGFPPDAGREEVEIYCGACHSLRLVAQQGLSRSDWDELLDWMVEEQAMEELEAAERNLILDYLARHLSVEARRQRRK